MAQSKSESTEIETIANPERGCGYLQEGKAYLRADISPDGVLPTFVEFDEPIPWLEGHLRGYSYFPGVQFELTHTPGHSDYPSPAPPAVSKSAVRDNPGAIDAIREQDPVGEFTTTTDPPLEVQRHIQRLADDTGQQPWGTGDHVGEMRVARAHDLLMWVGESYYDEPEAFISECKTLGLSKAIPTGTNQEPPVINPGRTRVFLIHPKAIHAGEDDDGEPKYVPGIIGYSYITRVIYTGITTGEGEVDFPEWAQEYAQTGHFDLVRVGAREPAEARENGVTLDEWSDGEDPSDDDDAEHGASMTVSDADDVTVAIANARDGSVDDPHQYLANVVGYHSLRSIVAAHDLVDDANPSLDVLVNAVLDADADTFPPAPATDGGDSA